MTSCPPGTPIHMALLQEFFAEMFRGHGQQLAFVGRLSATFGRDLLGRNIRAEHTSKKKKRDGNPIQISTVVQTVSQSAEYIRIFMAQIIKIQSYVYTAVHL